MGYYDKNRPYVRKDVLNALKSAPGHLKTFLKGLPRFYIRDENGAPYVNNKGEKVIFTTIPEILYDYLHGKY